MAYWVYQEQGRKKATVHDGECGYCRHGQGFRNSTSSKKGKWHGPFPNVFHALNFAVRLHPGNDRVHTCASGPSGSRQIPEQGQDRSATKIDIEDLLHRMAEARAEATKAEAQLTRIIFARLERLERAWRPSPSIRTGRRAAAKGKKKWKRAGATKHWVYENWRNKRVRIHRADCGFCSNGKGRAGKARTDHGRWHSDLFSDKEAALAYAQTLGYDDTRYCDTCLGHEG